MSRALDGEALFMYSTGIMRLRAYSDRWLDLHADAGDMYNIKYRV